MTPQGKQDNVRKKRKKKEIKLKATKFYFKFTKHVCLNGEKKQRHLLNYAKFHRVLKFLTVTIRFYVFKLIIRYGKN